MNNEKLKTLHQKLLLIEFFCKSENITYYVDKDYIRFVDTDSLNDGKYETLKWRFKTND